MNLHQPLGFAPAGDPVNFPSTCSSTLTDPRLCESSWARCLTLEQQPLSVWGGALETRQIELNVV